MPKPVISKASTVWTGDLFNGSGTTSLTGSGLGPFDVDWDTQPGTAGEHVARLSVVTSNEGPAIAGITTAIAK